MTVVGMGTVFLMLIILMIALILVGRIDTLRKTKVAEVEEAPASVAPAAPVPAIEFRDPSGLTRDQIAAITVAVATHAEVRRKQGAPVNRVHAPGSRLWASRWVSMGRSSQMRNTQRR